MRRTRNMSKARMFWLLALTGCASAPAYREPAVPVPASFRETRDTVVPSASDTARATALSWDALSDTTLSRLMKEVIGANLDVEAAEARVRGARASRAEVAFDLAPTVTFAGGYTRQR